MSEELAGGNSIRPTARRLSCPNTWPGQLKPGPAYSSRQAEIISGQRAAPSARFERPRIDDGWILFAGRHSESRRRLMQTSNVSDS